MKKDLNLAATYVPKWGIYEVCRELVANSMDTGDYEMDVSGDRLTLKTKTFPALSHMFVMGHGTKKANGATVGQFGEGLKLAALVCARNNWDLRFETPSQIVSFTMEISEGMDVPTLHAIVEPALAGAFFGKSGSVFELIGFLVRLEAPGVTEILKDKFLPVGTPYGRVGRTVGKAVKLYHRGMYVCEQKENALYHWNIQSIELNRDRDIPNPYLIKIAIGECAIEAVREDPAFLDELVLANDCYELDCLSSRWLPEDLKVKFTEAVRKRHGDKIVFTSGNSAQDQVAERLGYRVLHLSRELCGLTTGIQGSNEVVTVFDQLAQSTERIPADIRKEFEMIMDFLEIPAKLVIYRNDDTTHGVAKVSKGVVEVWLNENLLLPGNRTKRLSTLIHELGHIDSRAGDGSLAFEHTLDSLAGKLALAFLDNAPRRRRVTTK